MWLLSALPHWVFYSTLSLGVILAVGASVINLRSAQIGGCLLIWVATWFIGGIENDKAWQARVKDMEAKVLLAEAKSQVVNTKIITKTLTKIKLVKETTNANQKYITEYVAKDLDPSCKFTPAAVMLHDRASQNEVSGSAGITIKASTEIKASDVLRTVTENYGTYYEVAAQLEGWQTWYFQQKKIFEETK
jgi:hypothetical protein